MSETCRELVVISGKGGTGKTSLVASFAALAGKVVLADCDVDAADLHLVLEPTIQHEEDFSGGKRAVLDPARCTRCGRCAQLCRFGAILGQGDGAGYRIDAVACEGCGVCAWFCPERAIEMTSAVNGKWYISDTRHGPMVHAALGIAEENSGKLVTTVRQRAAALAKDWGLELILVDGSPGIGCPVIASITGADLVVIVTEPTISGLHDLERVADLAGHFRIPGMVCINKWDLNPEVTDRIEKFARERGLCVAGRVRYDRAVTDAQVQKLTVVEYQQNACASDIREVWSRVQGMLADISAT